MKTKTITQKHEFNASPETLYNMLMDQKRHAAFTGSPAKITNRVGGKFSVWDNYITGKNLELIKPEKIVQEWWSGDMPEGHLSKVTWIFKKQKNGKTLVTLIHTNVPAENYQDFEKGWDDFYWDLMKKWLKEV